MSELRKITVRLPNELLTQAQSITGVGLGETLRLALEQMVHDRFYEDMQALRGKLRFDHSLLKMEDRDLNQFRAKPHT